jgi:chromosome partitioning protein
LKTLAFFNNKGGVGKTSLVYHLAWMLNELQIKTLAVDLDPQSNLTASFLDEDRLEELWPEQLDQRQTVYGAIRPIVRGIGDVAKPHLEMISDYLDLVPGDLYLSAFEDKLSESWPKCHNGDEAAFRVMTSFHRLVELAASKETQLVLFDVGPNLGAINRAALLASDYMCVPLGSDLFSIQGLKNLGPTVQEWRTAWAKMRLQAPTDLSLPNGSITPLGYVIMQHGVFGNRPVKSYQKWLNRIPQAYHDYVLPKGSEPLVVDPSLPDPNCLALLKHFRGLMPMAIEVRKPIFALKSADGAIGAHAQAVRDCHRDFKQLALKILDRIGIQAPD